MADSRMDRETWENTFQDRPISKKGKRRGKSKVASKTWFLFKNFVKHLAIVVFFFTVTLVLLWGFTGNWPPVVVVKSGSMMHHSTDSQIGAVDTGDMIFFRDVDESVVRDVTSSWVERKEERYGTWGDVLIFEKNGEEDDLLIHRAVVWLEVNLTYYNANTHDGATYDIPSMDLYGQSGTVMIPDYPSFALNSKKTMNLPINLGSILNAYSRIDEKPRSGYVTKGDNNPIIDQPDMSMPVVEEWVMGKAGGEVPWLGVVSLIYRDNPDPIPQNSWFWLFFTLAVLFGVSITMEIVLKAVRKRRKERKERARKRKYRRYGRKYLGPEKREGSGEWGPDEPEESRLSDEYPPRRSVSRRKKRWEMDHVEEQFDEREDDWDEGDEGEAEYDDYRHDREDDWEESDEYEQEYDDYNGDPGDDREESDEYETEYDDYHGGPEDDWEESEEYDTRYEDRRRTVTSNRGRKRSRRNRRNNDGNDWSEDFFLR